MITYFRRNEAGIKKFDHFRKEYFTESPPGALHWIDLDAPTDAEAALLTDPFNFHPLAIDDCLEEVNAPKVDDYESYLFAIVHGIRFDAPKDSFETRELDFFLGPNYLITHHDLSVTSNRLNETMKRLTVISAMIAPLTVLTGIYGMNFEHLPELHWRYGYFFVLALVVVIPTGFYFWFKRKGWI